MVDVPSYDKEYYRHHVENSRLSGSVVLSHVLELIPGIRSVADLGCGTGAWLSTLKEKGVDTIQGYDGDWVLGAEALTIPHEAFQPVDLNKPLEVGRRFDLAISVEVAEHLQPSSAPDFVRSLTRLSDVVLFSAAIPGQTGTDHINEQWPTYWVPLFQGEGYEVVDVLRWRIWEDDRVGHWYRQNVLLFLNAATKADLIADLRRQPIAPPLRVVHPGSFDAMQKFVIMNIMDADVSATQAFRLFLLRARRAIERRLRPGGIRAAAPTGAELRG